MKTEIMEVCNQEMKKKEGKNKGFSLVELIVVIAIMAILAIVIAPQVMKYIGQSRSSVDETNKLLYQTAATTALADEGVYKEIAVLNENLVITISSDASGDIVTSYTKGTKDGADATVKDFKEEFDNILNGTYPLPKEAGKSKFEIKINVSSSGEIGKVEVKSIP